MKQSYEIMRGLREDRDLRQADVAEMVGISQQMYSRYEKGEYPMPSDAMDILADFYKVSVDYLLGRTECKEGLDALNMQVVPGCSVGKLVSDVLALKASSRKCVIEYVKLQHIKDTQEGAGTE